MAAVTATFPNEAAADKFIERYMQEYHPAGYGTRASKKIEPDGSVTVDISRYDSCD